MTRRGGTAACVLSLSLTWLPVPTVRADDAELVSRASLSLAQAIDVAEKKADGGTVLSVEIGEKRDAVVYEAVAIGGGERHELVIHAGTGEIMESDTKKARSGHAEIRQAMLKYKTDLRDLIDIASQKVSQGTAYEAEFDLKDSMLMGEVRFIVAGNTVEIKVSGREIEMAHGEHAKHSEAGEHAEAAHWNFDGTEIGKPPGTWSIRETHRSASLARWAVIEDESAPSPPRVFALTETSNFGGTFNLAVWDKAVYKDLDLTVKVKAVSGKEDQGGGPIWRCRNESNYYVCRLNPLEANFRLYLVAGGQRKQLATADVETEAGRWYTIRVTMLGEQITCRLDGEKLLEATDGIIKDAGRIGLWTKADAATAFDDLTVAPAGEAAETPVKEAKQPPTPPTP